MSETGLERAFMLMLGCITAADASRRQVNGILAWRDQVRHALAKAQAAGGTAGTKAPAVPSTTHRAWLVASGAIVDALYTQSTAAGILRCECEAAAEELEAEAAATEDEDEDEAGELLTQAAALRARAEAATVWQIAALEAAAAGRSLTTAEDAIARPVGEAIAAAGGVREVPGAKHYLTPALGGAR